MSDSDCSNCTKYDCEFRDESYDCYVRIIKDVKELVGANTQELKEALSKITNILKGTNDITYTDLLYSLQETSQEVLDILNHEEQKEN